MASARKTDWPTLALLVAMYGVLGANVWLYYGRGLHPVLHVAIGAVAIHLAFTIWHEAVHHSVSRRRWVNDVVGILGMLPYMTPYFMQKWVHLEHHRKLNQRDDPNFIYTDGPLFTLPLRYFRALGYAKELLKEDPRTVAERRSDRTGLFLVAAIYGYAAWSGAFWDAMILWFVPVVVAKLVMDFYVNYLPHAGLPAHRYAGTRIIDVWWFTLLVLGHNYHAVHHVWPTIPWHRYAETFRRKRDFLKKNGVPIEDRVLGSWGQSVRPDGEAARPD